ncbi:MAG: helix-turn-helix domain-containing protein, partial [Ktedonobacterales bacterium]
MVALPSLSPHTPRTQPSQPIDLLHRAPIESADNPLLAHDTDPSQTAHPASASSEPQPPTQSEQQQQPGDDEAAEDAAVYSPLLKDHVFALYCAGQRSPAIAAQLGISERTARHWIHTILQQLAEDDVTASPEVARQQR